jgi:hypothetical protein
MPVPEYSFIKKVDATFYAGPSVFFLRQHIASASVPEGSQDAGPGRDRESGTAAGFNVGIDAYYRLTDMYSVGLFIRDAAARVDLDSVSRLRLGGFQAGVGLRIDFVYF